MDLVSNLIENNINQAIALNNILVKNELQLDNIGQDQKDIDEYNYNISKILKSWSGWFYKIWDFKKSNTTEETPINMRKSNYSNIWTDSKKLNVLNKRQNDNEDEGADKSQNKDEKIKSNLELLKKVTGKISHNLDLQNEMLENINETNTRLENQLLMNQNKINTLL